MAQGLINKSFCVQHGWAFVKLERWIESVAGADTGCNHVNHKGWMRVRTAVQVTQQIYHVNKDQLFMFLYSSSKHVFAYKRGTVLMYTCLSLNLLQLPSFHPLWLNFKRSVRQFLLDQTWLWAEKLFTAALTNIASGCGRRCRTRWALSRIFKPWMFRQNSPVRLINHWQCTLRAERGQ